VRARVRAIVARAYDAVSKPPLPEQLVETEHGLWFPGYLVEYASWGPREATTFFDRMPQWLDVRDKSVLDVGCGAGALCLEAARRGARRVLGVDTATEMIRFAQTTLTKTPGSLPVEYRAYGGDPAELGDERFDVVLSKDAFEHYGADGSRPSPELMTTRMAERLREGGLLVIRVGPLWKAPYGGHIDTWLPWAHLIFPEPVIFDKYRRDRRPGKTARTFEEGLGVNRMTLARFRQALEDSGMECVHFATNVSGHPAVKVMRALARVPALSELCSQNVYGIWRRPEGWRPVRGKTAPGRAGSGASIAGP
jgi:SAM-dependent methyltransferase